MADRSDEPENLEQHGSDEDQPEITEIVEALPEEAKDELARRIVEMRMEAYSYRAPVPPPPMLRGYEDVVLGSAKQIMDDAHGQTVHRQGLESKQLDAAIANSKRGQWFGLIIAVLVISVGTLLILLDKSAQGLALILPGLAALVSAFIVSEVRKGRELRQSREAFPPEEDGSAESRPEID